MEDCVKKLGEEIKCRDSLIRDLYLLLADEPLLQSIFIYGHVSTGKSLIVKKLLEYLNYNYSIINCLEHTNNRSFFENIIIDLSSTKLSSENGYKLTNKCDNFMDFIHQIQLIATERPDPIVIVLEKCEKLRDMHENIFPAMIRLGELANTNICTILASDIILEKYYGKIGLSECVKIHFPQYTEQELIKILMYLTKPNNYSDQFYEQYLILFNSVFSRFCRDLNELRYMAKKNFLKYVEPIESNTIRQNDKAGLWRNIASTFRENLEVLYLRMSTDDFDQQSKFSREIESTTKLALSFELPGFAKYLLISAFLASYNPPKEDKRIFMKEGGPKKKRAYKKKKPIVQVSKNEGPRYFPLNRLLAIFCSIFDSKVDLNAILLTQIPSMCQLGLLASNGENNINEPKYKCCVGYEFIQVISRNINFDVKKYLYDAQI